MKIAAYQAPLSGCRSIEYAIDGVRARVAWCESMGVEILCCPEGLLGGLADDVPQPAAIAIHADDLNGVLAPLASKKVTTIVGFTEIDRAGWLYNTAAIFHQGAVAGLYRKQHPAINKSVYKAGDRSPVFRIGGLTFGIVICNDSNYSEPAKAMSSRGATVLFVPTNNGLPAEKADVMARTREADIARAVENSVWVIRADVAGADDGLVAYGCSEIVAPDGTVIQSAGRLSDDIIAADIPAAPRQPMPIDFR